MPDLTKKPSGQLGWQPGLDWEVYGPNAAGYRAVLYRRNTQLAQVTARSRVGLVLRMAWTQMARRFR